MGADDVVPGLRLIHISEPTRQGEISYAAFCLKQKKINKHSNHTNTSTMTTSHITNKTQTTT